MAKKEKFNLSTTQGLNVDYRSDTTRKGFNERGVYKGAINVQRSPLDALDILLAFINISSILIPSIIVIHFVFNFVKEL